MEKLVVYKECLLCAWYCARQISGTFLILQGKPSSLHLKYVPFWHSLCNSRWWLCQRTPGFAKQKQVLARSGHQVLIVKSVSQIWWKDGLQVPGGKFLTFGSYLSLVPHLWGYLIQLLIKGKIETADEKCDFIFSFQSNLNLWKVRKRGPIIQVNLQSFPHPTTRDLWTWKSWKCLSKVNKL